MVGAMKTPARLSYAETHAFVDNIFGNDMHAKRVTSLPNATLGVTATGASAIHLIGEGLAQARDLTRKHCIKQVNRLFSNAKLTVWELFAQCVPYVVCERDRIVVALDWTDFDADGHATVMLSLVTGHERSSPLIWNTVNRSALKAKAQRP